MKRGKEMETDTKSTSLQIERRTALAVKETGKLYAAALNEGLIVTRTQRHLSGELDQENEA